MADAAHDDEARVLHFRLADLREGTVASHPSLQLRQSSRSSFGASHAGSTISEGASSTVSEASEASEPDSEIEQLHAVIKTSDREIALKLLHGTRRLMLGRESSRLRHAELVRRASIAPAVSSPAARSDGSRREPRKPALAAASTFGSRASFGLSSSASPDARSPARSSGRAQHARLQRVCEELVETERRYHRDLSRLQAHFASRLEPARQRSLLPNLESFVMLSDALHTRMADAASRHSATALARALGAELRALAPFFAMYVGYCAGFAAALDELERLRRDEPAVEAAAVAAEEAIRSDAAADGADGAPVLLFSYLVKPVQRLCQYPLLYREVVRELARRADGDDGGGDEGGALEQARAVLGSLEAAAADVNARVRRIELEGRLWDELGASCAQWREKMGEVGATLALRAELAVEIVAEGRQQPRQPAATVAGKVGRVTRSLSFRRRPKAEVHGKVYVFTDCVLVARGGGAGKGGYRLAASWPLHEIEISLLPPPPPRELSRALSGGLSGALKARGSLALRWAGGGSRPAAAQGGGAVAAGGDADADGAPSLLIRHPTEGEYVLRELAGRGGGVSGGAGGGCAGCGCEGDGVRSVFELARQLQLGASARDELAATVTEYHARVSRAVAADI